MDINGRLRQRHARLPEPALQRRDTTLPWRSTSSTGMRTGARPPPADAGPRRRRRDREYYAGRIRQPVIPNVRRLMDACRQAGIEVIHTRIES